MDYRADFDALRARADAMERQLVANQGLAAELEAARAGEARALAQLAELKAALKGVDVPALKRELAATRRELKQLQARVASDYKAAAAPAATAKATPAPAKAGPDPAVLLAEARRLLADGQAKLPLKSGWSALDRARGICHQLGRMKLDAKAAVSQAELHLVHGQILIAQSERKKAIEMLGRGLMLEPNHKGLRAAMKTVA